MVKQHSQIMQICLGVCDLITIGAAWWAAWAVRFNWMPVHLDPTPIRLVVLNQFLALTIGLLVLVGFGLYRPRRDKSFLVELGQLLKAAFLIWLILFAVIAVTNEALYSRGMTVLYLPCLMAGLVLERGLFRIFLRYIRSRGWNLRHALIVGTGRLGQNTLSKLSTNSWTGIRVRGFVELEASGRQNVCGLPILGRGEDLVPIVQHEGIDCVFVALSARDGERLHEIIALLEETSVDVRVIPDLYISRFPVRIAISELDGLPILSLRENPLAGWPAIYKRVFDLTGAIFALLIFGWLMVLIAVAIKVTSRGAVIYRQRRVSVGSRPFDMFKFRTMRCDAESGGPTFASKGDPRCTRIGRWLRSTSLDELPQLLNVIKGDMSLVGPRPERPEMLERLRDEVPGFPMRLKVRAGLTGWAQINGFRGQTSFRKRLQYDLYYLNHWSPLLDVRIVWVTFFKGFRHPNAY